MSGEASQLKDVTTYSVPHFRVVHIHKPIPSQIANPLSIKDNQETKVGMISIQHIYAYKTVHSQPTYRPGVRPCGGGLG